jgi:hypothetical protein
MDKKDNNQKETKEISYLATGLALGLVFGVVFENIGLGLALGVAIGAALDYQKSKKSDE